MILHFLILILKLMIQLIISQLNDLIIFYDYHIHSIYNPLIM